MPRNPLIADRPQALRRRSAEKEQDDTNGECQRADADPQCRRVHSMIIRTAGDRRKQQRCDHGDDRFVWTRSFGCQEIAFMAQPDRQGSIDADPRPSRETGDPRFDGGGSNEA
jgi:hypothetical protein